VQTTISSIICVYDILKADKFIVDKAAVEKIQEVYAK
jgi:large subunit ribosomal protein L4